MPFPNFDPLQEGEAITASSLNTKLQDTRASINSIDEDAISLGALRAEHLSPIALDNLSTDASGAAVNMTHVNPFPTVISPGYINFYTLTPVTVPNSRGTFLGWGDGLAGTGWAGISSTGGVPLDTRAQLVFPLPGLTIMPTTGAATSNQMCTGLLVKVSVSVILPGESIASAYNGMGLSIFWQGNSSTYHYMPSSVAFTSAINGIFCDMSTTVLITDSDLATPFGGAAAETSVFSVAAAVCRTGTGGAVQLNLREWRISAIPIYGGSL